VLSLPQALETVGLNGAVVNKNIISFIGSDKSIAFFVIKPFNDSKLNAILPSLLFLIFFQDHIDYCHESLEQVYG
jgi:hypothetical protein